ncbi:unnamed protein product [Gongylonema pulchrum]|uniref:30S ribosomal protein S18 n=1 Tax=Gongylonema pulchrum TaxID=637853 RepID=A0A183DBC4_9BILA|nr:unnamed protein product [Gongylonema pulchrum]
MQANPRRDRKPTIRKFRRQQHRRRCRPNHRFQRLRSRMAALNTLEQQTKITK